MVSINSLAATGNTAAALAGLAAQLRDIPASAGMVFAFYDCGHDDVQLLRLLREQFPAGGARCPRKAS
jgi:hypothetical protein